MRLRNQKSKIKYQNENQKNQKLKNIFNFQKINVFFPPPFGGDRGG
jgi:hypothetical protein